MKRAAGLILFLLCGCIGERKSRRLRERERRLAALQGLIASAGARQQRTLCSFSEALRTLPPSAERTILMALSEGKSALIPLLTEGEQAALIRYVGLDAASLRELQAARADLLDELERARRGAEQERAQKGRVYRAVGYLSGAAVLLLML